MAPHVDSNAASSRITVLSNHITAASLIDHTSSLEQLAPRTTDARSEVRPTPNGGKGKLHVTDDRTGKNYELEIKDGGVVAATDFKKIKAGGDGNGLTLFDPGYINTAPVKSSISYIDGDKGILRYRGYPIEELAEKSTFLETAYLLLYGNLPTTAQLTDWEDAVMRHSAVPEGVYASVETLPHDAHPMGILVGSICALSAYHPDANPAIQGQDLYKSTAVRDKQIVRVLGKVPAMAAAAYHRATGRRASPPVTDLTYAENFLYMLDSMGDRSYRPHPRLARALDIMFILHAEHEMNCSTAAVRHLSSSGVDVYTALAGATGALYGPLHGGANEAVLKMLNEIGSVENIPDFVEGVKNKKRKLSGFGHRVYKNYDPRAKIIKKLADEVFDIVGRDPLVEVAVALEKQALSDDYFIKRKLYPNVDFYSGLIYRAMGFPTEFFPVLFAIPRMAGYLSHWKESLDDPDTKIIRPQQVYIGEWLRDYTPAAQRQKAAPNADKLGPIHTSNATKRRLAAFNRGTSGC